jgi:hypothetical protein
MELVMSVAREAEWFRDHYMMKVNRMIQININLPPKGCVTLSTAQLSVFP